MTQELYAFFASWPPSLATTVMSMLPFTEMQLAIPVAIHAWSMSPMTAVGYALIGNALVFLPLFFGLGRLRQLLARKAPKLVRPIDALLARGEGKIQKQYARYGAFALFLFTAIPLPLSGVWTATIAAVALKIPLKHAAIGIGLGQVCAAAIIVAVSTTADVVLG